MEGKNLITDCVSTTRLEELSTHSAQRVSRGADVLVSSPTLYVRILQRSSADIPIVMISTPDPVEYELVTNLARPEGNVTGVAQSSPELISKRIEVLKELHPGLARLA